MLEYDSLSVRILSTLTGERLPVTSWHIPERNEQRIAIAVCEATGMTPERWDRLTKDERIPWLHKTLKALEKQPAPNVWIEGDDLPVHRAELAREPLMHASHLAGSADRGGCSQLVSYLVEIQHRLADLRTRHDYTAVTCALLRPEGPGGTVLYDRPFERILAHRVFLDRLSASQAETFDLAFFPLTDSIDRERIAAALAYVERITDEIHPLLRQLPKPVREHLQLPESDNWWRIIFHLAWHFPRPFLNATRRRLLSKDGLAAGISDETFVQMHGMGGRGDLLPGLIYSALEHDLCTCSEVALTVLVDALETHPQARNSAEPDAPTLSAEKRRAFDHLRGEFEAGTQMPMGLECKLLKLADSFESPPATAWAGLKVGGCDERFLLLSKLNDQQEIVQIRGPATGWFSEVAERAGNALPLWIPDKPILFDDPQRGFGRVRSVMNRDGYKRWIGFVFATIKQHAPKALRVTWGTPMGPLSYGSATLDRDLCAASVLAIDLARLTTAAAEAANRERATCSPFTVPSMEEHGVHFANEAPTTTPPTNCTLGELIQQLRRFGEDYYRAADQIREENPDTAKHAQIQLGALVSQARSYLFTIAGFPELREWVRAEWGQEISFAAGRRIVNRLVERSSGQLSAVGAERMGLMEAVARLTCLADKVTAEGEAILATMTTGITTANGPERPEFVGHRRGGYQQERGDMAWDETLNPLREVLAELYPGPSETRVLLETAGVPTGKILLEVAAQTRWHNALREAHLQGNVEAILTAAQAEYLGHDRLRACAAAYRAKHRQDLPQPSATVVAQGEAPALRGAAAVAPAKCDLAIVTAMADELDPVFRLTGGKDSWEKFEIDRFVHYHKKMDFDGQVLDVVAVSLWRYGDTPTAGAVHRLKPLRPGMLAMTGICAGWEGKDGIEFGDVVIAEGGFHPREGKQEGTKFHPDTHLHMSPAWVVQHAKDFLSDEAWIGTIKKPRPRSLRFQAEWILCQIEAAGFRVAAPDYDKIRAENIEYAEALGWLRRHNLLNKSGEITAAGRKLVESRRAEGIGEYKPRLDRDKPKAHVGAFASDAPVIAIEAPFKEPASQVRSTRAYDLEVRTFLQAAAELGIPAVAEKGVSDYGTTDKDDHFRQYAAEAAACWLMAFARKYSRFWAEDPAK
jgi:nucleoside phosphorylase